MRREPAVAGRFYPREADRLLRELRIYCAPPDETVIDALAVVSPHAGYMFSGATAGKVFARVHVPRVAVVMAPNHTGLGRPVAVQTHGTWHMPMGDVPIEEALAQHIVEAVPYAEHDDVAHRNEHAAEVQVPFLQFRRPDVAIVPIILAIDSAEQCQRVGEALAEVIAAYDEPVLLVASTDMSHYISAQAAARLDEMALARILDIDPRGLFDTVRSNQISMCGVVPTTVALAAAKRLGANEAKLVEYTNSGEVSGDFARVVGYAGLVISKAPSKQATVH